jgi:hypothetical protein
MVLWLQNNINIIRKTYSGRKLRRGLDLGVELAQEIHVRVDAVNGVLHEAKSETGTILGTQLTAVTPYHSQLLA